MWPHDISDTGPSRAAHGRSRIVTADYASLLAAGIPKPIFYASSAFFLIVYTLCHVRNVRRLRRLARETEAKLQRLEQRMDDYERRVDAEMAQMRAELDAYGAWSDANDRFFHHGLVAVSHLIGARALPARRACATVRAATHERRVTKATWRPLARDPSMIWAQRRSCT